MVNHSSLNCCAAIIALQTVLLFIISAVSATSGWINTGTGGAAHLFLTFDDRVSTTDIDHFTPGQYVYVWGAGKVAPYRREADGRPTPDPRIVLTRYVPFGRDGDTAHNLTWWKNFQPSWVLYKCDKVTPAYSFNDPNMPLDFSNPEVVAWQKKTYIEPAKADGYDGMAMDNLALSNGWGACGIWRDNGTTWVQLYSGTPADPTWSANVISWTKMFSAAAHSLAMKMTINFSLGGAKWDSASIFAMGNHTDAVLAEEGFTNYGQKFLYGSDWTNKIWFAHNLQRHGKAYFPVNEFGSNSSVVLTQQQQVYLLASFIMMNRNASAIFTSPIQGYGEMVKYPLLTSFDIGTFLAAMPDPLVDQQGCLFYRNTTRVIAVFNPTEADCPVALDDVRRQFFTVPDGIPVKSGAMIKARSALVLQYIY